MVQLVKNLPANTGDARDAGSISGSGRSPGEGNGSPLQYPAWIVPRTEEHGRLQSIGFQRVGCDWTHTHPDEVENAEILVGVGQHDVRVKNMISAFSEPGFKSKPCHILLV